MELVSENKCFEGRQLFYRHQSESTKTEMTFAVYLPPQAETEKCPVLYWLSGLTCTAENFTFKAGAQRYAAELGLVLVMPDTSPRGAGVEGEDESYDLGSGAGFYVNATEEPWRENYQMYSYVTEELPALIAAELPVDSDRESIFGHSMGGHGALVCALKNPQRFRSVSAFAPICAPSACPWGQKALAAYLGEEKESWRSYDATELLKTVEPMEFLIDQGQEDQFYPQLNPEAFQKEAERHGHKLELRQQQGYDHSYYFIATFIEDHMRWHAERLK